VARYSIAERVSEELHREANLHVAVEEKDKTLVLSGMVETPEDHDTAIDIAARTAPGYRIDDGIEVVTYLSRDDATNQLPADGNQAETVAGVRDPNRELVGDFQSGPMTTDPIDVIENAEDTYSPPTDPVITTDAMGNTQTLGGTSATSFGTDVAPSASGRVFGDEAIADAIRAELRQDAATTQLEIEVDVFDGVARLRGTVPDLVDAENAEAVAARVPGVVEVREELQVENL
jgi:osmotically-inducible protein OsmY